MPCAFCQSDEPMTQEHLWPGWMAKVLDIDEDATNTQRFGIAGEQEHFREYQRKPFKLTAGAVCAGCNNGWMSQLEDAMKATTEGILRGRGRHLHERAQATISMWATVKLLVGEYTIPEDVRIIPPEHYPTVYEARDSYRLPLHSFEVHTAAYRGRRIGFYERTASTLKTTNRDTGEKVDFDAWLGTFAIGSLVLRVLGHTMPEPLHIGFKGRYSQRVRRMWPPSKPFNWPPGPPLDDAGLDWFTNGPGTPPPKLAKLLDRPSLV